MPRTKYIEIAQQMRRKIGDGSWAEGQTIPSENTLANEFRATRETIRRALIELRLEGAIDTAPGVGSWVRSRSARRYLGINRYEPLSDRGAGSQLFRLGQEHAATSGQTRTDVSAAPASVLPEKIRNWLALDADAQVLQREAEFRADSRGQQLWTSWLPLALVSGTPLADPAVDPWAGTTIGMYLAMGYQRDRLVEHVWARPSGEREARFFGLPQGAPVLVVERVMHFRSGHGTQETVLPLEAAVVVLPGEGVVLVNELGVR